MGGTLTWRCCVIHGAGMVRQGRAAEYLPGIEYGSVAHTTDPADEDTFRTEDGEVRVGVVTGAVFAA